MSFAHPQLPRAAAEAAPGDGAIIALGFSLGEGGKEISRTKVRRTWRLSVDGVVHEIHFTNSMTSGMKRVFVDDELQHESQVYVSPNFKYRWRMGAHRLSIVPAKAEAESDSPLSMMKSFTVNQVDCTFELRIDGKPFESYVRRQPPPQKPTQRAPQTPVASAQRQPVLEAGLQQTQAVVPEGAVPGQVLVLRTPTGEVVEVAVPPGCAPGQTFPFVFRPAAQQLREAQQRENRQTPPLTEGSSTPREAPTKATPQLPESVARTSLQNGACLQEKSATAGSWEFSWPDASTDAGLGATSKSSHSAPWDNFWPSDADVVRTAPTNSSSSPADAWPSVASSLTVQQSSQPTSTPHRKRSKPLPTQPVPWDSVSSAKAGSDTLLSCGGAEHSESVSAGDRSVKVPANLVAAKECNDPWASVPVKSFKSLAEAADPFGFSSVTPPAADPWDSSSPASSPWPALPKTASSSQGSDAGAPPDAWGPCIERKPSTSAATGSNHAADFWSTGFSPAAASGDAPETEVIGERQSLPADPWGALASATPSSKQSLDFWPTAAPPTCPDPWGSPSICSSTQAAVSDPWAFAPSVSNWPTSVEIAVR